MAIRCPHCGSSVMIRGNRSERAKLDDTAPVTVTVMVTEPEEDSPKKLTPEELEVMVCGWDIVDNEDAIRDLLLAAFPEAASYVEADDLGAEELLGAAYEKNPDLAVEMWRKVLDVAQGHLQEPERAEYLLCDLMGDIWYGSISLWFILKAMKQDENFARQVFGSAYVGYPQEELLKVCDDSGETELKAKLTSLLEKNPHFKGFE